MNVRPFAVEIVEITVASFGVDASHEASRVVHNLLELLALEVFLRVETRQQVRQPRTGTTQVPDVDDGRLQLDVTHALTAHLVGCDFNATTLTDEALDVDSLVLATGTLPRLLGSEDLLAEESILFGLVGAVVNSFGLLNFTR